MEKIRVKVDHKFIELIIELHVTFQDYGKIKNWLQQSNLNFGGLSPLKLIESGKVKKVLEFARKANEYA